MNTIQILGKYLDQPILVSKFKNKVPHLLIAGGVAYGAHTVNHSPKERKNTTAIRFTSTMAFTAASALAAPKIANKIFKNPVQTLSEIKQNNTKLIDNFVKKKNLKENHKSILEKAKEKVLSFNEVKLLYKDFEKDSEFLNKLIPNPENIGSKEIFSEIGRLSVIGAIPVVGGIFGGIVGDKLTTEKWKSKIPDKVKEGAYQYLANIFLCNVGAGVALALLERAKIQSKTQRAFGMVGGIVATGVIGGSAIANYIGNKVINPIFGARENKKLYDERTPEALDIGLHVDDIATVAVMSGLKWIEPALPIMYSISGYRAGIGYRNRNVNNCNK